MSSHLMYVITQHPRKWLLQTQRHRLTISLCMVLLSLELLSYFLAGALSLIDVPITPVLSREIEQQLPVLFFFWLFLIFNTKEDFIVKYSSTTVSQTLT